jgi:hypothetical protein
MFYEYWYKLCTKNVNLNKEDCKITISVLSFKKELEKSYQAGRIDERNNKDTKKESIADMLDGLGIGDIFGKKTK